MIRFDSISDNEEIHFEGGRSSGQIGGGSDKIGRIQIDRYEETTHINRTQSSPYHLHTISRLLKYSSEKACALRTTLEACCLDMIGSKAILNNGRTSLLRSSTAIGDFVFYPGLFFQKKTTMLLPSKSNESVDPGPKRIISMCMKHDHKLRRSCANICRCCHL